MDWLIAWLPAVTRQAEWLDGDRGESDLLTWEMWDPNDPRLNRPAGSAHAGDRRADVARADPHEVHSVVDRLNWQYAHQSATREAAKSSVSALRSQALELVDEEAVNRFHGRHARTPGSPAPHPIAAAERGTLYHRFLQDLELGDAADVGALSKRLKVLVEQGLFARSEAEVIELPRIAAFWDSVVGRKIRTVGSRVRRELPFTMRFNDTTMRSILGLKPDASLAGEFVVVQGVVDLAAILDNEIWLLDFKTDEVQNDQLETRIQEYRPQLRLYAAALEGIYAKPVRHQWLHFLAIEATLDLA